MKYNGPLPNSNKPEVSTWNRLEGRPRVHNIPETDEDFSRSLKAETYDALWMLTRQWQFGELQGDDAGTAIDAEIKVEYYPVDKFMSRGEDRFSRFDNEAVPLEARVEAEPIHFDLKMNLQISVYFRKCLRQSGLPASFYEAFVSAYPLELTSERNSLEALMTDADPRSIRLFRLLRGKLLNGVDFMAQMKIHHYAPDRLIDLPVSNEERSALRSAGQAFKSWFENAIYQNPSNANWMPDRLEYQFSQGLKKGDKTIRLSAEEFYHGRLDWYNFKYQEQTTGPVQNEGTDLSRASRKKGTKPISISTKDQATPSSITKKLIPTPVRFPGMPHSRWWAFEDGRVNFGKVEVGLNDLATLQLMEFGLLYGNDWHILPFTMPVGVGCQVTRFKITDVFGETFDIPSLNDNDEHTRDYQEWSAFSLTRAATSETVNTEIQPNFLFLPPVILHQQESKPMESVRFIRDEWNNLVWAVEDIIPGIWGRGVDGHEHYRRLREAWMQAQETGNTDSTADFTYTLISEIPENWFSFIPQRILTDNSEDAEQIEFVLAKTKKAFPNPAAGDWIKPLGSILSEAGERYVLREEEIPYSGLRVTRTYQRTRWTNGKVVTWIGRRKLPNFNHQKVNIGADDIAF